MPRGYRRVLLAAFAGLILANAAQHKDSDRQQGRDTSEAQHSQTAAPPIKPARSPDQPKSDQPKCISEDGYKRDCATAAAQATIDQARYAYWQALAGGVGVLIGFGTLIAAFLAARWAKAAALHTESGAQEARNAALEAKRSADAAYAANAVDLRPYLFVDRIEAIEEDNAIKVCIFFKNYGKVPARSIRAKSDLYLAPEHEPLRREIEKIRPTRIPVCAPGHERRLFNNVWVDYESRDALDTHDLTAILRIRWTYFGNGIKRFDDSADYITDGMGLMKGIFYILAADSRVRRTKWKREMVRLQELEEEEATDKSDHATPPEER